MAKCILWTPGVYEEFLLASENLLSMRQKEIIKMQLKDNLTIRQLAARLNVSEPTIHKDIKRIKEVYAIVQRKNKSLPPLFKNEKEMNIYIQTFL